MSYLPILIGVAVTGLILGVAMVILRRRSQPPEDTFPIGQITRSSDWELPRDSFANRRTSARREGQIVKVYLSSPVFKKGITTGYVIDRSTGGLRIAMKSAMVVGGTMLVRADNAPDTIPWVTVIIRSCRQVGNHYEVGCEFDKTPPWHVLLLFG